MSDLGAVPSEVKWLRRPQLTDAAVVVAAWLAGVVFILWSGAGLDDVTYGTPAQQVTLRAWSNGDLPLWSSDSFGGTPNLGNTQTAGLYPGHLLAAPFPDLLGTDVELALHLLWFGVGLLCLGRRLGYARPGPAVMAAGGMLSGAVLYRAVHVVHFPPLAWTPWALLAVLAVLRGATPRRAAAGVAVTTWCLLCSGHPQSSLMGFTLLGCWAVALIVADRSWRRIPYLAAGGGLALVMAAPVLMALRSSMANAAAGERPEAALYGAGMIMPVRSFAARLLGRPFDEIVMWHGQGEALTAVGATIVVLALIGAATAIARRDWAIVILAATGLLAASWSLGPRSPTLQFVRAVLPGFDQPRVSARWNFVLVMTLLVLAGAGVDRLRQARWSRSLTVALAAYAAVVALAAFGEGRPLDRSVYVWLAAGAAVALAGTAWKRVPMAATAVAVAGLALELGMPIMRSVEHTSDTPHEIAELGGPSQEFLSGTTGFTFAVTNDEFTASYLVEGMRPNANTAFRIRSIDGYDGGVAISRRWNAARRQIVEEVNDLPLRGQAPVQLDAETFARLGVRYVLFEPARGEAEITLPGWRLAFDGRFPVYENPEWSGDVIAWFQTEWVESPEAASDRIRLDREAVVDIGLVEAEAAVLTCARCAPAGFESSSDRDGHRTAVVDIEHPAVVATHEQFDDGWVVRIDGHEVPTVAVDGVWTGALVPAGRHVLEWEYAPGWVTPSLAVATTGLVGTAALWWWGGPIPLRRRRPRPTA